MLHLVFCFGVWIVIFTYLSWRSIEISQKAVKHLQRLHQIPCSKCAYFTGDYRLKCTVNPTIAMSETAIGCQDFLYDNSSSGCQRCMAANKCSNNKNQKNYSLFKQKPTYLK